MYFGTKNYLKSNSLKKRVNGLEETVMGLLWQRKFEALDHKKEQKQHGP